jgi:hypothetical protein
MAEFVEVTKTGSAAAGHRFSSGRGQSPLANEGIVEVVSAHETAQHV